MPQGIICIAHVYIPCSPTVVCNLCPMHSDNDLNVTLGLVPLIAFYSGIMCVLYVLKYSLPH